MIKNYNYLGINKFLLINFVLICSIALFLFSCKEKQFSKSQIALNLDSSANYPKLIDTSNFDLFTYFPKEKISRFEDEIINFEKSDNISFPDKNKILFVGSSSIRKWSTLITDMLPLEVIQRGFGGSTIPEVIYYSDKVVFKYFPKVIVFYCGENDHFINNSVKVYETFQYFEKKIHNKLPDCKLYFISIKPSPSRAHLWKKMSVTNRFIKYYCQITENTEYINIASKMFNENFTIKNNLFISDSLHLNSEGYKLWTSEIKPILEKSKN